MKFLENLMRNTIWPLYILSLKIILILLMGSFIHISESQNHWKKNYGSTLGLSKDKIGKPFDSKKTQFIRKQECLIFLLDNYNFITWKMNTWLIFEALLLSVFWIIWAYIVSLRHLCWLGKIKIHDAHDSYFGEKKRIMNRERY